MFDLKSAIQTAHHVTFLTGAGVSTASGIPDYRSRNGLYADMKAPETILSDQFLRQHHEEFHAWVWQHMYHPEAEPNVIHQAMAAIANAKGTIVTQNVDGLDQKAGAKSVVEFHGNLYRIYCQTCHQRVTAETYQASDVHAPDGGRLRPDIVLYGEPIAPGVVQAATAAVQAADLLVVVGTRLRVYPFAGLLQEANSEATLVAVNQEALALPSGGHMVVGDATKIFADLIA